MISVVGIGNSGSAIAEKFESLPQYDVYKLASNLECAEKNEYKLETYNTPEEYEKNVPELETFFEKIKDRVQVFIVGSSMSSIYSLGILEQIKDKQLDVFYIKPDTELLTGIPRLVENATYGILQEYARSGLFRSLTIISNEMIERVLENINLKNYYEMLNETIFSSVHYLNYFEHTEPHVGNV